MESKLIVSSSPHIRSNQTVKSIMRDVVIALVPATLYSVYIFRVNALITILLAIITAVATEAVIQKIRKKPITISDWSAVITGLLLAFNLPASVPWWIPVIGAIFAIAIVKHAFGGLGQNFMNPALAARAFLVASWPVEMTSWITPGVDAVSAATPLTLWGDKMQPSIMDAFLGNVSGCIGETSALLLIIGGIYLLYRGVIKITIPAMYIGTFAVLTFAFSGFDFVFTFYSLVSGGLMLGAIYMATDYVSSPVNTKGQLIFAFGCGLITFVIRTYGGMAEGVSFSILLMNVATPIIERYTTPKIFGGAK
ncbi:RnfABCDGE type electron transport complex subunit D [Clostridiaceae bacterium HSG29]|nr:RnfABCDGE type electron transport complex subunit D [Clostridiaceae bacterium HSG29]